MNALAVALGTTAIVFASGVLGARIGRALPEHHLSQDSKDVVKVGAGLIGTFSALVLGMLVVLVSWLAAIALCTGLFAPSNATAAIVAIVCSASAGAAIFLIVEMYQPFEGVMRISDAPLRMALDYLAR